MSRAIEYPHPLMARVAGDPRGMHITAAEQDTQVQNQIHTAGGLGPAPWFCLPLTEAVLVPAVGVAPGNRDGDRVEFPRLCSVCKGREDRKRGLGRGLAVWPAKSPGLTEEATVGTVQRGGRRAGWAEAD